MSLDHIVQGSGEQRTNSLVEWFDVDARPDPVLQFVWGRMRFDLAVQGSGFEWQAGIMEWFDVE